jgi:hypothetical protein
MMVYYSEKTTNLISEMQSILTSASIINIILKQGYNGRLKISKLDASIGGGDQERRRANEITGKRQSATKFILFVSAS